MPNSIPKVLKNCPESTPKVLKRAPKVLQKCPKSTPWSTPLILESLWRKGLLSKLKTSGIEGRMFNIIKDLYSSTNGHVTVDNLMSENFEIKLGVNWGDPPSPFFKNMYMDELCFTLIQNSTDVPLLNDIKVPCIFWADDLFLISTTKEGLQKQINFVDEYCNDWKLALNVEKQNQ